MRRIKAWIAFKTARRLSVEDAGDHPSPFQSVISLNLYLVSWIFSALPFRFPHLALSTIDHHHQQSSTTLHFHQSQT
jgi:hypothetical protein